MGLILLTRDISKAESFSEDAPKVGPRGKTKWNAVFRLSAYGLSILNTHLYVGASIILTDKTMMQREFWQQFKKFEATSFGGIEDVEINPKDSLIYFAVKRETRTNLGIDAKGIIYRFKDASSGIEDFGIYAGGKTCR